MAADGISEIGNEQKRENHKTHKTLFQMRKQCFAIKWYKSGNQSAAVVRASKQA